MPYFHSSIGSKLNACCMFERQAPGRTFPLSGKLVQSYGLVRSFSFPFSEIHLTRSRSGGYREVYAY